jgi:hypothetical protein
MSDLSNERQLFIVSAEHDGAYAEWWRTVHIPDVVATVPGIVSGQIYEVSPVRVTDRGTDLRRYLVIYEIEGDPAAVIAGMHDIRGQGKLIDPPIASNGSLTSAVFQPVTPRLNG